MADGFLGRWAKRKEAVRKGEEVPAEPVQVAKAVPDAQQPSPQPSPASGSEQEAAPLPTLADTELLTPESDFTRFVRPGVSPEVKNAAVKKLFADPHFNILDGLDTYIDDYGKPDPIPPAMLRQLASAKFLNLFRAEEEEEERQRLAQLEREGKAPTGREVADVPAPESVAQSSTDTEQALPPAEDHAHPDLRLQQDDAPGPEGPWAGSR
ncbi:MAG: hypothetical protein K0R58_1568 [Ramlibacter sp.]|nr:hypothetical protein [Ramlibacter sp.]